MKYDLFTRVSLAIDIPEEGLKKGDIATIVEYFEANPKREAGYALEVFNALGNTIAVIVLPESQLMPLSEDEVLTIRHRLEYA